MPITRQYRVGCAGKSSRRSNDNPLVKITTMIINAFQKSCDRNPLSPSLDQAQGLNGIPKFNICSWMANLHKNNLDDILFNVGGNYDSLQIRVDVLCKFLTKGEKIRPLVLMDGHGRTLYLIMLNLLRNGFTEEEINGKIKVVDISDGAVMWHERFFPIGVETYQMDIFDAYEIETMINPDTVFYFNFCGIKTEDNCIKCCDIFEANRNVMVSFSMARKAKDCSFIIDLNEYCSRQCKLVDDGRSLSFPTFVNWSD